MNLVIITYILNFTVYLANFIPTRSSGHSVGMQGHHLEVKPVLFSDWYSVSLQHLIPFLKNSKFFFFLVFRAAPKTYGGSQARGQIGAVATGLHHSSYNTGSLTH